MPGENPEAPPVADEARDLSEETQSDASAPSEAARQCFRGANPLTYLKRVRWTKQRGVQVTKQGESRSAPSE